MTQLSRILFLAHKFSPSKGGTQRLVHDLGKRLARRGHEVTVFTSDAGSTMADEWIDGMHVRRFKKRDIIGRPWYVTPAMVLEPIWSEFDILHSFHFVTFQSLFAAVVRRTTNVPFVMTPSYHPWSGFYEKSIGTLVMKSADRVIAQCRQERRRLLRYVDAQKIVDIPCGIDSNMFRHLPENEDFRRKYGVRTTDKVILYVGSLDGRKSVSDLIGAMPRIRDSVPTATLILIGGSSSQSETLERLSRLSLSDSVKILGKLDEGELLEAYSLADVFAFPSHDESFGIVLLEAAAAGIPIVSTRVGVAEELVDQGVNGFTLAEFSSGEFVSRIIETLSSERIRENAREYRNKVFGPYDWDNITDSLDRVYNSLRSK